MADVTKKLTSTVNARVSYVQSGFTPLENAPRLVAGSGGSIRARGLMPRASSLTGFTVKKIFPLSCVQVIGYLIRMNACVL